MSVVPGEASTVFGVPSGWIYVILGMADAARPGNMLMHLNCLRLQMAGYNTRSICSLGTSGR
jgi:hypothetical protein